MPRTALTSEVDEELLTSAEAEFKTIESAVEEFSKHADDADATLPKALAAIFEFVQQRDDTVLEAFIVRHKGRWGATAKKNRFQPLVKLAFGERSKPSHSKYATVLKFATTQDLGNGMLADWLEKQGTFTEAYKKAVAATRSSNLSNKDNAEAARIAIAKAKLKKRPLSDPFALSRPTRVEDGFIIALVHIVKAEGGARGYVSHVFEANEAAVDKRILSLTLSDLTEEFGLYGDRPLYSLYRAVRCLSALLPSTHTDGNPEHQIVIENRNLKVPQGARVFTRMASDGAPYGEIALGLPVLGIPQARHYALSPQEAEQLTSAFRMYPHLTVHNDPGTNSITFKDDEDKHLALTIQSTKFSIEHSGRTPIGIAGNVLCRVVLPANTMKKLLTNLSANGEVSQQNPETDLLPVELTGTKISAIINGKRKLFLKLANNTEASDRTSFGFIRINVLTNLCMALAPYGNDVTGEIQEHTGGKVILRLQHTFDEDRLSLCVPFVRMKEIGPTAFSVQQTA